MCLCTMHCGIISATWSLSLSSLFSLSLFSLDSPIYIPCYSHLPHSMTLSLCRSVWMSLSFYFRCGKLFVCCWITFKNQYKYFQEYTIGNDEVVRPFVRICYSAYAEYFEWTIYIIEGALLSFGAFLAWETRHVSIARNANLMEIFRLYLP